MKMNARSYALALATAFFTITLSTVTVSAAWTPPANASVETIYSEIRTDFQEKRYEDALAKHLWYHENSREVPGQTGVRVSFAVNQWSELGKVYPPALEKMKSLRDQLEIEIVKERQDDLYKFMEFNAFNGVLGDSKRTVAAIITLEARSSPLPKQVFLLTFSTLVTHQEFKLAGKYLNSDAFYATTLENYQFDQKQAAGLLSAHADRFLNHSRENFINKTATAVAVLIKNNRQPEAQKIANFASKVLDTPDFKTQLEKALQGEPPAKQFP